ncbi:Rix1 complex component [Aspergillus ambiguus]|uniref:IPI1/TEX10 family protein n=1 Tax=Aspergillus ambiguus TaxID=176160 RepID=UPI003CCC93A9
MGSSTKKKKEKQKDFQKAKLKVGKARAKPDNFTDTSFKAKAITLNQQSLQLAAPSTSSQFAHHVSLLSSKSDAQRRDSLAHLTTHLVSRPVSAPLPQPVSALLPPLLPLILDPAASVRAHLLRLLRALPAADIADHVAQLLPYLRAAMTHLAADIRLSAVDLLSWLVDVAGPAVVACPGGWIKTLNCFLSVLGWHTAESAKWSASRASFGKAGKGSASNVLVKVLAGLAEFLAAGLTDDAAAAAPNNATDATTGAVVLSAPHMIPPVAAPYVYLNLFGQPRDEDGEMYETREDRYRVFAARFLPAVQRGLESARMDGGEIGRASSAVTRVVGEAVAAHAGLP